MRNSTLSIAVIAALGVLLYLMFGGDRADSGSGVASRRVETVATDRDKSALDEVGQARERLATASESTGEADPAEAARLQMELPKEQADEPLLEVRGVLVEGATGNPIADATLNLQGNPQRTHRLVKTAVTDDKGRFQFRLAPSDWEMGTTYGLISLSGGDIATPIFNGSIVLEPELFLRARSHLVLRGQLLVSGFGSVGPIWLRADIPQNGSFAIPIYAGRSKLEEDGRFEMDVWVDRPPAAFELLFAVEDGTILTALVSTTELIEAPGVTLECTLTNLVVVVLDEDAQPLPRARLNLRAAGLEESTYPAQSTTTEDGRASFVVGEAGVANLCVALNGYAYLVEEFEVQAGRDRQEKTIVLRRLGEDELLRGNVIDAEGNPLGQVFVVAWPGELDYGLAMAGQSTTFTDDLGLFELPVPKDATLRITASRRDLGAMVPEVFLAAGEREVELRFDATGRGELVADLVSLPNGGGSFSGAIEWAFFPKDGSTPQGGHEWSTRLRLEQLPAGTGELFVCLFGAGFLGQITTNIKSGEVSRERIRMISGSVCEGTLTLASGEPAAGYAIEVAHPDVPEGESLPWNVDRIHADGSFRLVLDQPGLARIRDKSNAIVGQIQLRAGSHNYQL
ncbi:MAG: hypothetical protein ACI9K5_001968 [Gammaproteobacteria bacterium]|jgi:hypothetical protein